MEVLSSGCRLRIAAEVKRFVDRVIERRVIGEPFDEQEFVATRPFHAALAPMELWKAARFERSFVTAMGQSALEQIAEIIASERCQSIRNRTTLQSVSQDQLATIQRILDGLERGERKPDWQAELSLVDAERGRGAAVEVRVISDLWVQNPGGQEFYEMKSSKPNSDQTKVSKEKMLKLYAMDPSYQVYFALPDNPYVTRQAYGWPHPKRWFNMTEDPCVLIGSEFWDNLGGEGTYEGVLSIFREVGEETRPRIRREVLGIED